MSPLSPDPVADRDLGAPEAPVGLVARERLAANALAADIARLHGDALLRTARRWSSTPDDAYDAYQRALERLLLHAATIDRSKAVAWMHVVVRREAGLIRRQEGPSTVSLEDGDVDEALIRHADVPDDHLHAIDLAQRAGEALATLKDTEAQALCLRAQGMSYEEIADTYGWSYTKVNRAVTEGRRAFAAHYTAVETGAVCSDTAELIDRYVDGSLRPRVAIRVRAHLVRCSGCRALLHAHRGADHALRALLPPVFVAAAGERTAATGWLHEHLLGPLGHLAGRLQPGAELALSTKVGAVAATTAALAGGGVAVERIAVPDRPRPALQAGITAAAPKAPAAATRPASGPLVRIVEGAVDTGTVTARVRQRAAAEAATARRRERRERRARQARRRAAAVARRASNAREFAPGVAEFDTTTRASAQRAAGTAASTSAGSTGSAASTGGGGAPAPQRAPEIEVPVAPAQDESTIDVITEESGP